MEPPIPYGTFHILYVIIGFAVCALFAWLLRGIGDKSAERMLFSLGFILAVSELIKQGFYYFMITDRSYHWYEFPFQMCSIPMYLCLLLPLVKIKWLKRSMYAVMALYNFPGGAIAFSEPSGMFHSYWFLTLHSISWHMILVFIGLFILFSRRAGARRSDYVYATAWFIFLSAVAFLINYLVQTRIGAEINMFFVGPGKSPIIVFEQFCEWFGWQVNTLIYLFVACLGVYGLSNIVYIINRKTSLKRK